MVRPGPAPPAPFGGIIVPNPSVTVFINQQADHGDGVTCAAQNLLSVRGILEEGADIVIAPEPRWG